MQSSPIPRIPSQMDLPYRSSAKRRVEQSNAAATPYWICEFTFSAVARVHGRSQILQADSSLDVKLQRGGRMERRRRMEGGAAGRYSSPRKVVGTLRRYKIKCVGRTGGPFQPDLEDCRSKLSTGPRGDPIQSGVGSSHNRNCS